MKALHDVLDALRTSKMGLGAFSNGWLPCLSFLRRLGD
jgi:hypothetical protein